MGSSHQQIQHNSDGAITLVALLKTCAKKKDLYQGSRLHSNIIRWGLLGTNVFVGSTLVSFYAKCGALGKAQEVFDELTDWNVVSWNALIAGYTQYGQGEKALHCFEQMQLGGFSPSAVTIALVLKACGTIGALRKGQEIHAQIVRQHLSENRIEIGNGLVDMYSKCGAIEKAQEVFDKLRARDTVSWNVLIAGYVQHELGEKALECFDQMQDVGFPSDPFTFACILKACGSIGALEKGQEIYAEVVRQNLLEEDIHIGTSLVDMYAKCGALGKAHEVFDKLQVRDVVLWNALIAGYAQHEHGQEALNCFERMQFGGFSPNAITFASILKACGSTRALDKGVEIHTQIVKERLLDKNLVVANALVDMYVKCGALTKAHLVFDELPVRNVVLWNALISGYTQHGHSAEALQSFEQMQSVGCSPDPVTFACLLKACGCVGAAYNGQMIHAEIVRHGFVEEDIVVGTALVDMYANCGMLGEAQYLFDRSPLHDVVLWSVLVVGYAQIGKDESVFNLFHRMIREGTEPDTITFTIVLHACTSKGLMGKGQTYFETMSKDYGIIPALEHHTCMVNLLGHSGHVDKAVAVFKRMLLCSNLKLWHTMLGACQRWGNVNLGRWAFERIVQSDKKDAASLSV